MLFLLEATAILRGLLILKRNKVLWRFGLIQNFNTADLGVPTKFVFLTDEDECNQSTISPSACSWGFGWRSSASHDERQILISHVNENLTSSTSYEVHLLHLHPCLCVCTPFLLHFGRWDSHFIHRPNNLRGDAEGTLLTLYPTTTPFYTAGSGARWPIPNLVWEVSRCTVFKFNGNNRFNSYLSTSSGFGVASWCVESGCSSAGLSDELSFSYRILLRNPGFSSFDAAIIHLVVDELHHLRCHGCASIWNAIRYQDS